MTVQGVGSIMGGIMVMQAGKGNMDYVFTEKNFGQFASNEEVGKSHLKLAKWQAQPLTCVVLLLPQILASCASASTTRN